MSDHPNISRSKLAALPFVFINVATTADGKIAPANRHYIPFGSARDLEHLYTLRAQADAVICGARTIDLFPATLGYGGERFRRRRLKRGLAEHNIRVIVSGSGSINPRAEIFKHRFSPIIILTTQRAGPRKLARLRQLADEVRICGEQEIDFVSALRWLRKQWHVRRLLSEGGGALNDALFRARVVNEIHLTLCPVIFGGRRAPTMADGIGAGALSDATKLKMKSLKRHANELFLVFEVVK